MQRILFNFAKIICLYSLVEFVWLINQGQNLKRNKWQKVVIHYLPKTSKYLNMRGGDLVMFWYVVRIFSCRHYHHYPISRVNITLRSDVSAPGPQLILLYSEMSTCSVIYTEPKYRMAQWSGRCEHCESRTVTEAGWHRHSQSWPALIPLSWSDLTLTHGPDIQQWGELLGTRG